MGGRTSDGPGQGKSEREKQACMENGRENAPCECPKGGTGMLLNTITLQLGSGAEKLLDRGRTRAILPID